VSGFIVDTSALISILVAEEGYVQLAEYMDTEVDAAISAATLHEAFCVCTRQNLPRGAERLERMVSLLEAEIVPFDAAQLVAARQAYREFGRGSGHRAGLNMGDCFSYALAKIRGLPLLFKGDDFVHTDIRAALGVG
jgi:ribonuclease VapC